MNARQALRLRPRSLAGQLYAILFAGLLAAYGLSFGLLFYERYDAARAMMFSSLQQDVATSVPLLDRLPAAERAAWLPRLERRTYRYLLGPGLPAQAPASTHARKVAGLIDEALGHHYRLWVDGVSNRPERFEVHLVLGDGSPLAIEVTPSVMPVERWLPVVFLIQVGLLLLCAWLAVRLVTRPLARLAGAASALSLNGGGLRMEEGGPSEVAEAAAAFNAMQARITQHLQERLQILAAISHDLQTPITRMQLRVEAMDDSPERGRLLDDLGQMQHLVRDGVAYARSAHGAAEAALKVDLDAFLDTLVCDYQDTGRAVSLQGRLGAAIATRPHALRRALGNLVDNALKYAGAAELHVEAGAGGMVLINVLDRGPGIPAEELERVMQPFYRLEASRNRDTGGTGLGLAIAQQLAYALDGNLALHPREGGGLRATLALKRG